MVVIGPKSQTLHWILLCLSLSFAQDSPRLNTRDSIASTCPFKTINYITHSLAQQCLATTNAAVLAKQEEKDSIRVGISMNETNEYEQAQALETHPSSTDTSTLSKTKNPELPSQTTHPGTDREPDPRSGEDNPTGSVDNAEEESELESGNFLSFEEWKKQNLKKVGQPEHIAHRNQGDFQEIRKRPANVHNSLDSLGDEGEIDIDFSGLVPGGPQSVREVSQPVADHGQDAESIEPLRSLGKSGRSKDAGTTCKERFNYASFDCAANILKMNKEAKSAHTVLMENKDSYMLNQCSAQSKFIIFELCNDVKIDTIVLANFEFFSSTFRTFRVSVSGLYPVETEKWKVVGTYEARNTREIQAFLIENPALWARYVRIEFLTHYGNEFYCPVSLIRIHGQTMFEEYKEWKNDNEDKDDESNYDGTSVDSSTPEAVAEVVPIKTLDSEESTATNPVDPASIEAALSQSVVVIQSTDASSTVPASVVAFEAIMSVIESSDTCIAADSPSAMSSRIGPSPASPARIPDASTTIHASISESLASSSRSQSVTSSQSGIVSGQVTSTIKALGDDMLVRSSAQSTPQSYHAKPSTSSSSFNTTSIKNSPLQKDKSGTVDITKNTTTTTQQRKEKPSASTTDRAKSGGSPSEAQPATPTMQESFFRSVQKRLQMLEANSSLSLQYIEDQSRALRDAFKKVEQRQLSKTTTFLDQLNQTVLNELRDFRHQYDQLWQSTVIELELQRERYERDNEAINARLSILADEVIFQRRMAILQMVLILVCLVLVVFSRGVINNYLELPLVQNVLSKSPSSKWLKLSGTDSPAHPSQPARMRSAHQLRNGILKGKGHRRMQSEDSITDTQSGPEVYAPPTPVSDYGHSGEEPKSPIFESDKDEGKFDDPEFDPNSIERPSTSPPVLRVNGNSLISDIFETSEDEPAKTIQTARSNSISNDVDPPRLSTEFVPIGKRLSWDLPNS